MDNVPEDHPHFVSIDYFVIQMLGLKSRSNYYNHRNDEGWPQRVYPTGKPMLVYEECVAYQRSLMQRREPPPANQIVRGPRAGRLKKPSTARQFNAEQKKKGEEPRTSR